MQKNIKALFRFSNWPLRAKVVVLLVVASTLPLGIAAFFELREVPERLKENTSNLLAARADQLRDELDQFNLSYKRSVDRISHFPDVVGFCQSYPKEGIVSNKVRGLLKVFPASDKNILAAVIMDLSGTVRSATQDRFIGVNAAYRSYFQDSLRGIPVVSDVFIAAPVADFEPVIAYTAPIFGPDRKLIGIAVLSVRASALWEIAKASNELAGHSSFAVMFDHLGIRIAHTFSDEIIFHPGGKLSPSIINELVVEKRFGEKTAQFLQDVRSFPEQFDRSLAAQPDERLFRGFAPVNQQWNYGVGRRLRTVPWTIFYMIPEKSLTSQIANATQSKMLFAIAIIVAALLAGALCATAILNPIKALSKATESIAGGDLSARVSGGRTDELGKLGQSFNSMAEQIEVQARTLQKERNELDRRVIERTAELEAEIAERKRAEEAAMVSQRLLQGIIDNSTTVIYVKALDGRYLLVNRRYCELFHVDQEAVLGRTDNDLFAKEVADAFRAVDERVAAGGVALTEEETAPLDDGLHTYVSVKCPLWDSSGKPYAVFGISTDITDRKQMEEALRSNEERIRLIVETALDAVVAIDSNGIICDWNPQAEIIFGWTREEAMGRLLSETIIPEQYREAHRSGLERYLATSEAKVLNQRLELSALHRHGREFPIELSITPIKTGNTLTFSAFVRDITNRKRAEQALRESEERFRTMANNAPVLIWVSGVDKLCTWFNRQWLEFVGRTMEQEVGNGWAENVHPDDFDRCLHIYTTSFDAQQPFSMEYRLKRHDGEWRWILDNGIPCYGAEMEFTGYIGSCFDITESKQAAERLHVQLERLNLLGNITRAIGERQDIRSIFQVVIRTLEDHLPVDFCCVCLYDSIDNLLTVNSVGVGSATLAMELALTEQARVEIDQNGLSRCVRGQLVYEPDITEISFSFPQRLAKGGLRSLVITPLVVESKVFGILVVARREANSFTSSDCEFLRQLSEHVALASHHAELYHALQQAYDDLQQTQQAIMQQERLRALGQMASGIAHDINNAISPVALYTESLLENEPDLSPRTREYLETISRSIDDVAATVARMREFYRQRGPQLALIPVHLNRLVQEVIDLTRARWSDMPQQKGIVIKMRPELARDLPTFMGVESEIREMLTNLIFNAVDAMPKGGTLSLKTSVKTPNGQSYVCLEVLDTGVGMDEDTKRRCMEPFFTTKGERGTGLGLAMVYGIVQRQKGEIEIESATNKGTAVRIAFAASYGTHAADHSQMDLHRPVPSRLRILIVDDDPLLLKSLGDILEAEGHVVVKASGGKAGINAFREAAKQGEAFPVVITDLGMPTVDGRKVAAVVKEASPSAFVILLTGWGQRLVDDGEVPSHVDWVLNKPPKLRELNEALVASCSLEEEHA